jgi:hypothetical protein
MSTGTTASQLDRLRESVARLEADGVPRDNPFVQGLLMQITRHERDEWRKANGGWWGENSRFRQMPCTPGRGGRK